MKGMVILIRGKPFTGKTEIAEELGKKLKERGFQLKKDSIASVVNSHEAAINLIQKFGPKVIMKMHFCQSYIYSNVFLQLHFFFDNTNLDVKCILVLFLSQNMISYLAALSYTKKILLNPLKCQRLNYKCIFDITSHD